MNVVDPRVHPTLVPQGSTAKVFNGPHGNEYRDLPSVRTPNGYVITRWEPTIEEREALARGEDVYVTLLSAGNINPFFVTVGPTDWTKRR